MIRPLLAIRDALAVAIMTAAVLSLGADLAHTAYTAAQTAQTVVLSASA